MMKIGFPCLILLMQLAAGCGAADNRSVRESDDFPGMFPDYREVTIPPDIAPLNFRITEDCSKGFAVLSGKGSVIKKKFLGQSVTIPQLKWKRMLMENKGGSIKIELKIKSGGEWKRYKPFNVFVAEEPIESWLVYRLIMPGFQNWNKMGIYQRSLSDFRVKTILDSRVMQGTCMNCHSFPQNNPGSMVLHLRESYGGTILFNNGTLEKLSTKTEKMFGNAAFPSWHPSKKYIAFSVNRVNQIFHATGPDRATALDLKSDIVLYDVGKHEMKIPELLSTDENFETFPCFSPDGKTLYFCSAAGRKLPGELKNMKYSLCAVSFDENTGAFGTVVDTLISSAVTGRSISIPRVSPDGRYLMYTVSDFGAFPSYNPEADLWIMDLLTGSSRPLDSINSGSAESWHSWSSNGRWVAFSSRRTDGLYSNVFLSYMDRDGNFHKPFILPQKDPDLYRRYLYSFNVPELITGEITIDPYRIEKVAKSTITLQVQAESSH